MREGWEIKKLGEVCEINYGTRVVQKRDGGSIYPVYGGGGATFKMDKYNREDCLIVSRFAMSPQCVRYVKGKFFLNDSGLSVESSLSVLSQEFLNKHIIALNDKIYSLGKGAAQKNLDVNAFKNIDIHYPMSLSEQERIVEELDCLSGVIEKKKQQLKELDALAQSIFYEMFGNPVENDRGWVVKPLKDVAPNKVYKGEVPSVNDKYWLLNLDMISSNTGEIIQKCYFDLEEIGNSTIAFNADNVLYSKLRPYLNKVVVPNEIGYATSELIPLCPNGDVLDRTFFALLLRSSIFVEYISNKVAGAKMPRVSMGDFWIFPIILPSLTLQQQFAEKIESIEKQKELIRKSIEEVEMLFNSRMDYYFG